MSREATQFKPGPDPRRGVKPKGSRHITPLLLEALKKQAMDKNGNPQEKTYMDLLIARIMTDAISKGNESLIRLVLNYVDGMPKETLEMTVDDATTTPSDELLEVANAMVEKLRAKKTG